MDELNAVRAGLALSCSLMAAHLLLSIPLESAPLPVRILMALSGPVVSVVVGVLTVRSGLDQDQDGGDR